MAFQYGSYAIPQAQESPLAALLPAFEAGQQKRKDEDAAQAFARLSQQGPYQQPQGLADLANPALANAQPQGGTIPDSYLNSVIQSESGGNPNARNPSSSATGLAQFTDGTWQSVMQAHPELGLTPDGRTNPAQATAALRAFTLDNAKQLATAGIQVSPGSLYAAHFLGAGGASKVLSAPDNTPIGSLAPDAVQANPSIANMTVGQFKAWAAQKGGGSGAGYAPPAVGQDASAPVADRAQELSQFQDMGNSSPATALAATQQLAASGQTPPSASVGAPASPAAAGGLPDRATMLALFRSPDTRPLAVAMVQAVQAVQAGQSPKGLLDQALERAQINAVGLPAGYRRNPDGTMGAIPGGPDDPNNPLNAFKTMGASQNGMALGTTGSAVIDPTADGYASQAVVGGMTQAAIDQKALAYVTSGTNPPTGRTGIAGAQNAAISNRMAEMDASGNLASNKSQLRSLSQSLATQQKYLDTVQRSVGNAEAGFQQVIGAFKDKGINASQYPTINAMENAVKAQLSPGDLAAYQAGLTEVANEYSQVFSRGGQVTDAVRARSASIANGDLSIGDLGKVLAELQAQGDIVVKGSQAQVKQISDQINGIVTPGASPAAGSPQPGQPVQIKGDDDYNALPSGATFIGPDGQTRQKP